MCSRQGRCHQRNGSLCGAAAQQALHARPHLGIIWTQIVYLVFLKCYQCFLCAFVSPLQKKGTSPTLLRKPPPKTTRPSGRCTDFSVTTNKMGAKLTQKDTFYPHPLFPPGRPRPKMHRDFAQRSNSSKPGGKGHEDAGTGCVKGKDNLTSCKSAFILVCCYQPRRQSCHLLT